VARGDAVEVDRAESIDLEQIPPEYRQGYLALLDLQRREHDVNVELRREVLRFAAVNCTCRPWYSKEHADEPPQVGCIVHGALVLGHDGVVM
jgi:hypothetical protein